MPFIPYDPRAEMPSEEDNAKLTAAEREAIWGYVRLHVSRRSPLDYALVTRPEEAADFRHARYVSDHVTALVEDRLYAESAAGLCPHVGLPDMEAVWRHPDVTCHVPAGSLVLHNLGITEPPRHGKSWLVSEHTPAWYLSRHPSRHVILASYEGDFAASWGQKAQNALLRLAGPLGIELDPRSMAKESWKTRLGGSMDTAGVGGPITGKGGNLLVADDLIKNAEEANSATIRQAKWDWFISTFLSRRTNVIEKGLMVSKAKTILMHTRWNEDDPMGRVMSRMRHEWFIIDLPAIAGDDDQLGRAKGAALCPEMYPLADLVSMQAADPFWFEALYQGRPSPEGAGLFARQNIRFWRTSDPGQGYNEAVPLRDALFLMLPDGGYQVVPLRDLRSFLTVDLAASKKTAADFSVFAQWGVTPPLPPYNRPSLVLLRMQRERMEAPDHMRRLAEFLRAQDAVKVSYVGIEKKTFGLALIQKYKRIPGLPPLRELEADVDKVTRAIGAGALSVDGRLYIPAHVGWGEEWVQEHIMFPNGTHDDMVDTTAYAERCLSLYHDYGPVLDETGHTPLPGGQEAGRSIEERFRIHMRSKAASSIRRRQAANRL